MNLTKLNKNYFYKSSKIKSIEKRNNVINKGYIKII